jgi:hypothetical protein
MCEPTTRHKCRPPGEYVKLARKRYCSSIEICVPSNATTVRNDLGISTREIVGVTAWLITTVLRDLSGAAL